MARLGEADAEHLVLYRAIADFSDLIREAAEARAAMAALEKDAGKLGKVKPAKLVDPADAKHLAASRTETEKLVETIDKTVKKRKQLTEAINEENDATQRLSATDTAAGRLLNAIVTARAKESDRIEKLSRGRLIDASTLAPLKGMADRVADITRQAEKLQKLTKGGLIDLTGQAGLKALASRVGQVTTEAERLDRRMEKVSKGGLIDASFLPGLKSMAARVGQVTAEVERLDREAARLEKNKLGGLLNATNLSGLKAMASRVADVTHEAERLDREAERLQKKFRGGLLDATPVLRSLGAVIAAQARAIEADSERMVKAEEGRARRYAQSWERAYRSRSNIGKLVMRLQYPDRGDTDFGGGGGGRPPRFGSVGGDFDDNDPFGRERSSGRSLLRNNLAVQALIKTLPLIPPLVGAATASLAGMLSTGVVALAGIAGFAAAAIGHIKAIKDAVDDFQKTGVLPTGPVGDMVKQVYGLKAAYSSFLADTQQPVFQVFNQSLGIAAELLRKFTPATNAAAEGLSRVGNRISEAIDSPEFDRFLNFLERRAPDAIDSFGGSLVNIVQGILNLTVTLEPFMDFFLDGFERMTTTFRNWALTVGDTQGFQDFIDYAKDTGPAVMDLLKAIADALINIGVALGPLSTIYLAVATALARLIAAVPPGLLSTLIGLFVTFSLVAKVSGAIQGAGAVGLLAKAIRGLFMTEAVTKILGLFGIAAEAAGGKAGKAALGVNLLRGAITGFLAATGIGLLFAGISLAISAFGDANNEAAEKARKNQEAIDSLADALERTNGIVDSSIKKKIIDENQDLFDLGDMFKINPGDLAKALTDGTDEAFNLVRTQLEAKRQEIRDAYANDPRVGDRLLGPGVAKYYEDQLAGIDRLLGGITDVRNQMPAAQKAYERNAQALAAVTDTTLEAAAAQKLYNDTLAAMREGGENGPFTDSISAVEAYRKAQADAAEGLKDITRAEADYAASQRATTKAQEALNEARQEAADKLEDLKNKVADAKLNEDEAQLGVETALDKLQRTLANVNATDLDVREAQLAVRKARAEQRDTKVDNRRNQRDYDARKNLPLEQQPEYLDAYDRYITAKGREADANDRLADARTKYGELQTKVTEAQTALDVLAASSGKTRDQLIGDVDKINGKKLVLSIDTSQLDEADKRLAKTMTYFVAIQLMNQNPDLTADEAFRQAQQQVAQMLESQKPAQTAPGNKKGFTNKGDAIGDVIDKGKQQPAAKRGAANKGDAVGDVVDRSIAPITFDKQGPAVLTPAQKKAYQDTYNQNQAFKEILRKAIGYAGGGEVDGPGTSTSDSVPALLSRGEHVWTAAEVVAAGGHAVMRALRNAVRAGVPQAMIQAAAYGRSLPQGGAPVDVSGLYAGLSGAVRSVSMPSARFATGGPVTSMSSTYVTTNKGGLNFGDVVINNPVRERSDRSIRRAVERLAFLHDG